MGDKEFQDFLDNQDDDDAEEIPECQKRLLFEIIQTKLSNSTDLVMAISDLYSKEPKDEYKAWLGELETISKQAFDQLDFLMTMILDEINTSGEEPPEAI